MSWPTAWPRAASDALLRRREKAKQNKKDLQAGYDRSPGTRGTVRVMLLVASVLTGLSGRQVYDNYKDAAQLNEVEKIVGGITLGSVFAGVAVCVGGALYIRRRTRLSGRESRINISTFYQRRL